VNRTGRQEPPPFAGEEVRAALVRQWQAIGAAVPGIELDRPSRVDGWRNREVLAHLYVQPIMLGRFLETSGEVRSPALTATTNLAGTRSFGAAIDTSAREGAALGKADLAASAERVLPALLAADLGSSVVTVQGSILLVDYLVTRCVEAVVHGGDLIDPVEPDPVAQSVAARALMDVLATTAPDLVTVAESQPMPDWIDLATGRRVGAGALAQVLPVMA